ncbi:MAG TPA: hypothetical protein VF498_12850 [Anaerolineales bacterium]
MLHRWAPSYPETTGYTIPTLLNAAARRVRPEWKDLALCLAEYLLKNATSEGGAAHWQNRTGTDPVVFDTGQVIFGWLAAFEVSRFTRYLQAAEQAGDWLVSVQDASGSWKRYQYLGVEKVIDTRVAWALLELHRLTGRAAFRQAALSNLEWALQQQSSNGWFQRCAFRPGQDPLTHTLAYTAEGLFECGCLLDEPRYLAAARRMADALLARQRLDGGLASTYRSDWSESSHSSCLTGNCQMARLWLRLDDAGHGTDYREAAGRAIAFVARTQDLGSPNPNVRGGIAGSQPLYGHYERFKYPNWAAKFFIDALLTLDPIDDQGAPLIYKG